LVEVNHEALARGFALGQAAATAAVH
jgi:hypothetical protein